MNTKDFTKYKPRQNRGLLPFLKRFRVIISVFLCIFTTLFLFIPFLFSPELAMGAMTGSVEANEGEETGEEQPGGEQEAPGETPFGDGLGNESVGKLLYKLGDDNSDIARIQETLMNLGYMDSDEPTTKFGSALEDAVKRIQRTHYLEETGTVDEKLMALLESGTAMPYVIERGNKGNDVLMLQTRLNELGFYQDKNNGYFGVATENAVGMFQAKNELTVNGRADLETRSVLYSPKARYSDDSMQDPNLPLETGTPAQPSPTATRRPDASPTPRETPKPSSTPKPNVTPTPTRTPAITPRPTQGPAPTPTQPPSANVETFISILTAQLRKPYVWSTEGPDSFDCSGLVYYCLRQAGVRVSRYTAAGYSQVESWGLISRQSDLKRGDLVFFSNSSGYINHVGVYLGYNSYIHASSSAGEVVISSWNNWAVTNFELGRRVF